LVLKIELLKLKLLGALMVLRFSCLYHDPGRLLLLFVFSVQQQHLTSSIRRPSPSLPELSGQPASPEPSPLVHELS